ncbi:unnamed protein product [Discula destructiva]
MLTKFTTLSLLAVFVGYTAAGTVPQKRADICGMKGYDRGNGNYFYNASGKRNSYAACSTKCASESKCKSFGYSKSECMLFNIPLSGNFDANSGSSDTYYDRGCLSSTASSPGSTASTKTTSSITTKTASTASTTSATSTKPSSTTTTTPSTTAITTTSSSATSSTPSSITTSISSALTTLTTSTQSPSVKTAPPITITSAGTSTPPVSTTSSSSSSTASVTVPSGCSAATSISITSLTWFNSTHNLDCASANYPADAQVCWNQTSLCNSGDAGCTCTPYCYTGLPAVSYQPLGYGPPDRISIVFDGGASGYSAANPQPTRRFEIGEGHFGAGSAADIIGFYGDSNKDTGNMGSVYYNDYYTTGCNGKTARYTGSFPLFCTHDAGNNATCTAPAPVTLTLASLG